MFNSDARQDEFVANLLKFKKNGYFLDIGSCDSIGSNNTFFFESLDWNGVCVEIEERYNSSYERRRCHYLNKDALQIDYEKLFLNKNFPNDIDYLSLDIDSLSYDVLTKLPLDKYKFKAITIEHDFYLYGLEYKQKQIDYLNNKGYFLLCENVYVQQAGFDKEGCPFEDWYIDPFTTDKHIVDKFRDNISKDSSDCIYIWSG